MAAISLFWNTNMAAVTSCANALYLRRSCAPVLIMGKLRLWYIRVLSVQQVYFLGVVSVTITNALIFIFLLRHAAFLKYTRQINLYQIANQQININSKIQDSTPTVSKNSQTQLSFHGNKPVRRKPYVVIPRNYTRRSWSHWDSKIPIIYVITPTYQRPLQKAELTRISQTFRQVKNLHWIVIEDSEKKTVLVKKLLNNSGIKHTHLAKRTRAQWRLKESDISRKIPIVVDQRNFGLSWIRRNVKASQTKGIVYFADDDNTYDLRIFEQMRWTKEVSVWPVGFVGGARWAGPVCNNGRVVGFHTKWHRNTQFPMDNAGFAVNIQILISRKPNVNFLPIRERVQSKFLEKLTTRSKLEGLANDCKKVYVWSTQTEVPVANTAFEAEARKHDTKRSYPDFET